MFCLLKLLWNYELLLDCYHESKSVKYDVSLVTVRWHSTAVDTRIQEHTILIWRPIRKLTQLRKVSPISSVESSFPFLFYEGFYFSSALRCLKRRDRGNWNRLSSDFSKGRENAFSIDTITSRSVSSVLDFKGNYCVPWQSFLYKVENTFLCGDCAKTFYSRPSTVYCILSTSYLGCKHYVRFL